MVVRPSEGGAFEHVSSLSRALAQRGHEVAICGPHGHHLDLGVEVIELDIVRRPSPRSDLRSVAELSRIVRGYRPRIVHAHGSKGGVMSRLARLAAPRTPVVFTPHGFAFAGHFSRPLERRAYRIAERALAPLASRTICVCEAEARLARSVGAGGRVRVVHNGIDPPAELPVDPQVKALAVSGPLLGVLSGLRPGKGLETMVESLAILRRAGSTTQLVVAGEGGERERLERLASGLGVSEAVHLPGHRPDPYAFLGALDAFVLPSWAESFPYSVLEAMAAGLPIVACDVGGVSEASEDGVSGLRAPARDPVALAARVGQVLDGDERSAELGRAARVRRAELFSMSAMVAGTAGVYAELG
jgi:glycosyltransferase involved in cell wall biosynthesis